MNNQELTEKIEELITKTEELYTKIDTENLSDAEKYDIESHGLNMIAVIASSCPGITYLMNENEIPTIPEGARQQFGVDEAAQLDVYREEHYT